MSRNRRDDIPDAEILRRFEARDEQAIADMRLKYGPRLFALACRLLGNRQDSEECCADTYLALWNAIPPAKPQSLSAYAHAILHRLAVTRFREKTREKRVPSELTVSLDELFEHETEDLSQAEEVDAHELAELLNDWLRSLSADGRYVFISRWYEAKSVAEIARGLSVSESAVYKTLTRLKGELRVYLERNGITI